MSVTKPSNEVPSVTRTSGDSLGSSSENAAITSNQPRGEGALDQRTRFLKAVGNGQDDEVKALLGNKNGMIKKDNIDNALLEAVAHGHSGMVRVLLDAGANVHGDAKVCESHKEFLHNNYVMRSREYACGQPACKKTVLQLAVEGGHIGIVSILVDASVDIDAKPLEYQGKTALQAAAGIGHAGIVSVLLDAGADIHSNPSHYGGRTALQAAAGGGHSEIVSILLEAGAKVEEPPSVLHGRTALQAAAEGGHSEIVSILLKAGAKVEAPASLENGRTALQAAAGGGYTEIVWILLKAGAKVEEPPSASHGRTALQAAAEGGHVEVVSMLLKADAKSSGDGPGEALSLASSGGHVEVVSMLLKAGAEPWDDGYGTALQEAAQGGHSKIVSMLLNAGAKPLGGGYGTALSLALLNRHAEVVSMLLNASDSSRDVCGREALLAAARHGHTEIVTILLEADTNPLGDGDGSPLSLASSNGHVEVVSMLLKAGAEPSNDGYGTALSLASSNGHPKVVSMLLKSGAKPSGDGDETALSLASSNGHIEVVSMLLKAGAEPSNDGYGTALSLASSNGHIEVVSMLLKSGAKPSGDGDGAALSLASSNGHPEVVSMLLKAGAKLSNNGDGAALSLASSNGHSEVVSMLLNTGAKRPDNGYGTALYTAAECGHAEIVRILLEAGPEPLGRYEAALQVALVGGHIEIVSILLKAGINVNDIRLGKTMLQEAAGRGNAAMIKFLISNGAYVNFPGNFEEWPLWIAAKKGHAAAVDILLQSGARTDLGSPDKTVTRVAAESGNRDVVQVLLDSGVDINARDSHRRTCLFWGISDPGIVQMLVERHAKIDLQALGGETPLHYAVEGQHAKSVILLLNAGANIESEDFKGRKPLDILLDSNSSSHLVKLLLEHGCDFGRRGISIWRAILEAKDKDVIMITETSAHCPASLSPRGSGSEATSGDGEDSGRTIAHARPSVRLDLVCNPQEPPCFNDPGSPESPAIRRLYFASGTKFLFPALGDGGISAPRFLRERIPTTGSVIGWQWLIPDGNSLRLGYGLDSFGGRLTTIDIQVLLSCYVCFQWFGVPDTKDQKSPGPQLPILSRVFHTKLQKSEISWIMRKPWANPGAQSDPIFRTEDFRSTLDIGWIPGSGLDFFAQFVLDIHRKWREILEKADTHLATNRKILLQKKGRTNDFIDNLLLDAQQWSDFRALLQIHVRKAMDLVKDFKEKQYLSDEVSLETIKKGLGKQKKSAREIAIKKLATIIRRMESEVELEIRKLDERTKEMIELEFNLVSIHEVRTSKEMGMSMKRLSWITFVFLPLMFVTSFFGMNIDLINGGPHWTWVIKLTGSVFGLVILVWVLLKLIPVDKWLEGHRGGTLNIGKLIETPKHLRRWRQVAGHHCDLELGDVVVDETFEFKPLQRQWTKLKDL